ncbi:MAG: hypothetical protein ACTSUO_03765 [Candidatus Thorarchaeota archaeon]
MGRVHEFRETLFGNECAICRCDAKEELRDGKKNPFFIHRKDGTEHSESALLRLSFLLKINPEEWVGLCTRCHKGVHWLMENKGYDWNHIEKHLTSIHTKHPIFEMKPLETKVILQQPIRSIILDIDNLDVREVRKRIFGDDCHFCKSDYGIRRLNLHRKDGRSHDAKLLWSKESLIRLNPEEWIFLCTKCHNYVGWSFKHMRLKWDS